MTWNYIISAVIINFVQIIVYFKIVKKKFLVFDFKIFIIYLLQTILIILNYTFVPNLIKVFLTFIIMIITCRLLFKEKNIIECINVAFITETIVIISELIFSIISVLFNKIDNELFAKIYQGALISNISISLISLFISSLGITNKVYNKLNRLTYNISKQILIIFFGLIIVLASLLFNLTYYDYSKPIILLVNTLIVCICFVFVIFVINKENKYNKIYIEHSTSLKQLEEYESIINEFRITNHENENQLNSIKGITNNRKVHDFINTILDNKTKSNKIFLKQALLIPTGGLRGLISSKLFQMNNFNINYTIHIDKKLTTKIMSNVSTKDMSDICQIVGVYIDNAIDDVKNRNSIEKKIFLNIYVDDNINIEIMNPINSEIDLGKIKKIGYTTKAGNHGYGLSLANKILKENQNLKNETIIFNNMFKQKLIIKIK